MKRTISFFTLLGILAALAGCAHGIGQCDPHDARDRNPDGSLKWYCTN